MNSFFLGFLSLLLVAMPQSGSMMNTTPVAPMPAPVVQDVPPAPPVVTAQWDLTDKGSALVQTELLDPLSTYNKIQKDMFSRCGSGFYYMSDDAAPVDTYYHGVVWFSVGCDGGNQIVKFRVDRQETQLDVLDTKTHTYITPAEWLINYRNPAGKF